MDRAKRVFRHVVGADKDPHVKTVSSADFLRENHFHPGHFVIDYLRRLFPILGWITKYNLGWLSGDLVAGLTVGIILVPQSMSYAKIATLPPQYGLYSSFVGVFIYCFFATSKDVSIGPVAVMSLEVANVIARVDAQHKGKWSSPEIATTLALFCGFITLGIGLLRLGWLVEFISAPAVAGFMTGSAITIASQQVPGLLGLASLFNTRAAAYYEIIHIFKNLPHCTKDAAFGLFGLFALYLIHFGTRWLGGRYPRQSRFWFFVGTARYGFVIIILTLASYLYCHPRRSAKGTYPISILQTVPRGFQHLGAPPIDRELVSAIAPDLPVSVIIMLLEHIAIGKSFGRINGYKIDPNQELVAIGVTNTIGSLFNAYPATGSFSRTAVKSKSGVRSPLAGLFTGATVIVALYALTGAFFWIPSAGLSAIIIAAVGDLVASPRAVYSFWRVNPLECIIWWAAVFVTVFSSIENGIYTAIAASGALLIFRIARPRGAFLGRVIIHHGDDDKISREVFVPIASTKPRFGQVINPHIKVELPAPGVVIYRPEESVLYPNSSLLTGNLVDYIKANTKRGKDMTGTSLGDRPWNDAGPRSGHYELSEEERAKPILYAVVLDFTSVSNIDTTAVQNLIDVRWEIERWADREVAFHFCHITSPWIRRGLIAGGFGIAQDERRRAGIPIEIAPIVGPLKMDEDTEFAYRDLRRDQSKDAEAGIQQNTSASSSQTDFEGSVLSTETPYFHFDISSAVRAAEREHRRRPATLGGSVDDKLPLEEQSL
jgi:sodium-independent sulfate anion transporter 11